MNPFQSAATSLISDLPVHRFWPSGRWKIYSPVFPADVALFLAHSLRLFLALFLAFSLPSISLAQQRWFQVEVSIFSNESPTDHAEEGWQPDRTSLQYPPGIIRLKHPLDWLVTESLLPEPATVNRARTAAETIAGTSQPEQNRADNNLGGEDRKNSQKRAEAISVTGPFAAKPQTGFRFFNYATDSFIQLPAGESDFRQTNQALERSPDHRLLFHGLWRQPVENTPQAVPLYVSGGRRYDGIGELEGSLTIRFNNNRDRVVIDTNLWLTRFGPAAAEGSGWQLPAPPPGMVSAFTGAASPEFATGFEPLEVFHMQQSRPMRSNEFHYLDNPALGAVVMVMPYELPSPPPSGFDNLPLEPNAAGPTETHSGAGTAITANQ